MDLLHVARVAAVQALVPLALKALIGAVKRLARKRRRKPKARSGSRRGPSSR